MKLDIITSALPPKFDAIGHYTALFSKELVSHAESRILVPEGMDYEPIDGVTILPCFSTQSPEGIRGLIEPIAARQPDWVLLEFNPFMYGRRGYAPQLIPTLRELKRRSPKTRLAAMIHERFAWGDFKLKVMATWQIPMFLQLGNLADQIFISTSTWTRQFAVLFPRKPVQHLPVGSTIPHVGLSRDEARARLQIPESVVVVGVFGTAHVSRMLHLVREVLQASQAEGRDARLLYIGPNGETMRQVLGDMEPISTEGPLPFEEISRRFMAMDLYLAPFSDGVSTRRTSLMASLQHGIASVGTRTR